MARQYIGPKVQTQVPEEQADWISAEARRRGVDNAVVVRELIERGYVLVKMSPLLESVSV